MRVRRHHRGFTLIEMTVVVIIVGILVGIASVSWGWFTSSSHDNAGGASIDNVITVEQGLARDWGSFSSWPADLSDVGGGDTTILNNKPSTNEREVSVAIGSNGTLGLAIKIADDDCIYRRLDALTRGATQSTPEVAGNATCSGADSLPTTENVVTQTASIRTSVN